MCFQDYEIDIYGYPQYKLILESVEIYKDEFESNNSKFHLAYSFLYPFQK